MTGWVYKLISTWRETEIRIPLYGHYRIAYFLAGPDDIYFLEKDTSLNIVNIPALIKMKQLAGRAKDLDDIEHLKIFLEESMKRNNDQ